MVEVKDGELLVGRGIDMRLRRVHGGDVYSVSDRLGFKEEDILDFSANVNPLGPSRAAKRAAKKAMSRVGLYPDPEMRALRLAVARYFGVKPEHVVCGNGATALIHMIPRILKPRRVLIPSPTFAEYAAAVIDAGGEVVDFPLNESSGFGMDPVEMAFAMKGVDMAILCNPNNPTGRLVHKSDMLEILNYAREQGVIVVLDEAFMDFTESESLVKEAADFRNIICLRAFTKFFGMPGLRVGCAVAHEDIADLLSAGQEPWPVSTPASHAVIAALSDWRYIKKTRTLIQRERERMLSYLRLLPGVEPFPCAANFILVKITAKSELGIAHELRLKGILVRDCSSFPGLDERYIRIAVRGRRENERLLSALRRILIPS